ncbi:esterase/lipase family protein [Priestia megaterium]|uniref:esterase/lipase family protein n=1 Tax=Priestia megaterium TaxID=1404 RepID=UPI002452BCBA|nr:alpha/beta fold hydrolase [Priestia megaterium]MDH3180952.1 hypothetical protein [Priestia megaterium]
MLDLYQNKNTIVINTRVNQEEVNKDKLFVNDKTFDINNKPVSIYKRPVDGTFLEQLPYTAEKKLLLVDLQHSEGVDLSFNLLCEEDEYFFVVEELCFDLYNAVDYIEEEGFEKSQLPFLLSSKFQTLRHRLYKDGQLKAELTNKGINNLLSYTDEERKNIDHFLSLPFFRLKTLFKYDNNTPLSTRRFYIVIGKLEDGKKKSEKNSLKVHTFCNEGPKGRIDNKLIPKGRAYGRLLPSDKNMDETNKPIAIIVHGLGSSSHRANGEELYSKLIEYLTPNFHVFTYDYLTINQPIDISGKILAEEVKKIKNEYNKEEIIVIAHSMGGLVSRSALVRHDAPFNLLVMAGTPNKGSIFASLTRITSIAVSVSNWGKIKRRDFIDAFHWNLDGLRTLGENSDYIKKLNQDDQKNEKKYFYIAGKFICDTDGLVSIKNAIRIKDESRKNFIVKRYNHLNYFTKNIEENFTFILENRLKDKKISLSI